MVCIIIRSEYIWCTRIEDSRNHQRLVTKKMSLRLEVFHFAVITIIVLSSKSKVGFRYPRDKVGSICRPKPHSMKAKDRLRYYDPTEAFIPVRGQSSGTVTWGKTLGSEDWGQIHWSKKKDWIEPLSFRKWSQRKLVAAILLGPPCHPIVHDTLEKKNIQMLPANMSSAK